MKKISFGLDQTNKPTPGFIKLIYKTLMFCTLMWQVGIEPRFQQIPEHTRYLTITYLSLASLGLYFFCQCFGYSQPDKIDIGTPPDQNAEISKN